MDAGGPAGDVTVTTSAVRGSAAVLDTLARLEAAHGPLAMFMSGGCCDGTHPMCLQEGELTPGAADLCIGRLGATPVYIGADQYRRWGRPSFAIDVAPGAADGFSLEGEQDVHFTIRTPEELTPAI